MLEAHIVQRLGQSGSEILRPVEVGLEPDDGTLLLVGIGETTEAGRT